MTGSTRTSGEAFAFEQLSKNPQLDYAAVQQAAAESGVTLQPIQYGRARRQLGLSGEVTPTPAPKPAQPAATPAEPDASEVVAADDEDAGDGEDTKPAPAAATGERKGSPAFEFLVEALRADPTASYGDLKVRADAADFRIAPIMYGRAKALLGLVPVRPRGSGKQKAKAEGGKAPVVAPNPPRSLKQVESVAADAFSKHLDDVRSVEQLVDVVRQLDGERRRLRGLLEQIANTIDEALGYGD